MPLSIGKQLVPIAHMRVFIILGLQPGRGPAIGAVRAVRPLDNDALQIMLAPGPEEIMAAMLGSGSV